MGIGVPGLYDPARGTTRFLPNLTGTGPADRVAARVAAALGVPAHLINDARAFGLAELRLGAGRGASSMVGLTLGTGVGGVVAVDGHVLQGHDGTAGELGHQTLDPRRAAVRLRQPRLPRGVRARRPDRRGVRRTETLRRRSTRARRATPARAPASSSSAGVPGHRHRQHGGRR